MTRESLSQLCSALLAGESVLFRWGSHAKSAAERTQPRSRKERIPKPRTDGRTADLLRDCCRTVAQGKRAVFVTLPTSLPYARRLLAVIAAEEGVNPSLVALTPVRGVDLRGEDPARLRVVVDSDAVSQVTADIWREIERFD